MDKFEEITKKLGDKCEQFVLIAKDDDEYQEGQLFANSSTEFRTLATIALVESIVMGKNVDTETKAQLLVFLKEKISDSLKELENRGLNND